MVRLPPGPVRAGSGKPSSEVLEILGEILESRSLDLVFQPIYALKTGRVFGFEVLTRSPSDLFNHVTELYNAAAQSGQVGDLGRIQRSLAIKKAPNKPLFINVHPAEFDFPLLIRPDDPIFRHTEDVFLELTESAPLNYFEQCTNVLGELRKKGMKVAIDDFGAGFSNVKYIADLSPDIVKLDRDLIAGVREATRQFRLLLSIVRLCHDMGAKVVAEGIETAEELVVAEHAGVEYCQGFLLGRPDENAREESWPAFR